MAVEPAFVHARTVETRWGLGLAFIDLDDENDDVEVLKLQLWQPVEEGGGRGRVTLKVGLSSSASDEAHDVMSVANRQALVELTADRFEAAFDKAGVGRFLDGLAPDPDRNHLTTNKGATE